MFGSGGPQGKIHPSPVMAAGEVEGSFGMSQP